MKTNYLLLILAAAAITQMESLKAYDFKAKAKEQLQKAKDKTEQYAKDQLQIAKDKAKKYAEEQLQLAKDKAAQLAKDKAAQYGY